MISKRVLMKSPGKSSIRRLVRYLVDNQGKSDRIGEIRISNCHSEDLTWATREMVATQCQNTRTTGDKTYHLVISFPLGDEKQLDSEKIREIENRFCKELGFEEHQRVAVLHRDTDNLHLHVVVNKIHPKTHTVHEPYYDFQKHKILRQKLEIEFGLERTTGRSIEIAEKAATMEHIAGVESLVGYVKRSVQDQIKDVKSWQELHKLFSEKGVVLKERGSGLVVESGGYTAKASSCLRSLSKNALEKRLGAFKKSETAPEDIAVGYKPQPVQAGASVLYKQYQVERELSLKNQQEKLSAAVAAHRERCQAAAREYKQQKDIVFLTSKGNWRKTMLKVHKARYESRQKSSFQTYQEEKSRIYQDARLLSWNDWLVRQAEKGSSESLEVLKRRRQQPISEPLKTKINENIKPYERYRSTNDGGIGGIIKQFVRKFASVYQSDSGAIGPKRPPGSLSSMRNLSSSNVVSQRKPASLFLQSHAHDCLGEKRTPYSEMRRERARNFENENEIKNVSNEKGYITRGGSVRGTIAEMQLVGLTLSKEIER